MGVELPDIVKVSTLRVKAGDLVLIQASHQLPQESIHYLRDVFQKQLPKGVSVIVNPITSAFRVIRKGKEITPEGEPERLVKVPGDVQPIDFDNIGKALKQLRKATGQYQRFAAAKADLSESYLWRLEKGLSKSPTWKVFVRLVHSYGFQIRIQGTRITVGEDIGIILAQCREEFGYTQLIAGRKIGVAGPTISKTESNTELPSWGVLVKLFKLYGLVFEFALQEG